MTIATDAQEMVARWQSANVLAADCPSRQVLQHLTSRWGALVMIVLATGQHRFSELRRQVQGISERMLAQTLQDLEADGFVLRVAHPVVPPHVDYSLTTLGEEAAAHVMGLARFVESALPRVKIGAKDPAGTEAA
ncbi:winged helix-turn-helix transcriptional regulator [Xinfangfangia pollutisoli]|uniref:winged helix-turn-helix transcriptional regulator n=1 Tax=Xinfangfangia pollutisoli TaxID=2865960 RepID=UPI001CD7939C|nr:helix-turn-helix domain-containing protein [Xinfangfangia pollutisoli]